MLRLPGTLQHALSYDTRNTICGLAHFECVPADAYGLLRDSLYSSTISEMITRYIYDAINEKWHQMFASLLITSVITEKCAEIETHFLPYSVVLSALM